MLTADNARKIASSTNDELITYIESRIKAAATEFKDSIEISLDSKYPRQVAEKLAEIFRSEPRCFEVQVDGIRLENFGPIDCYALSIGWGTE